MNEEHAYSELRGRLKRNGVGSPNPPDFAPRLREFEQDLNRICANALKQLKPEIADLLPMQWNGLLKRMKRQYNLLILSLFLWIATLFVGLTLHYQWRELVREKTPSSYHLDLMLKGQKEAP